MRRSLFFLLLAGLAAFGTYRYFRLAHRPTPAPTSYTPAEGPKVDLKDVQVLAALDAEYSRLIATVMPSVVSITSSRLVRFQQPPRLVDPFDFFFPNRRQGAPQEREQSSLGSGVIVSREGHVLTNHHVIAGMETIEVQLTDGRRAPARLLGADEQTDIAVLQIDASNVVPLPFGDSDHVTVGQLVFAIGNPFGLQATVTQGIVSAKGRRAVIDSGVEFLQTDAAVNQGNSGGPLLNIRGEIVGLNSAIYSNSEAGSWLGISFAIPANTARRTLESLLKHGRVVRGYLGVQMADVTLEAARQAGLPDTTGAAVLGVVHDSPAAKAGLEAGDIIRTCDGQPVDDILALRSRVAEAGVGQKVELGVWRNGQLRTLHATVAEAPADLGLTALPPRTNPPQTAPQTGRQSLRITEGPLSGATCSELTAAQRQQLSPNLLGVLVTEVQPGSAAAERLQPGDIIAEVGHRRVPNLESFEAALRALRDSQKVLLLVVRAGSSIYVVAP